jgi:hypothetical protein
MDLMNQRTCKTLYHQKYGCIKEDVVTNVQL